MTRRAGRAGPQRAHLTSALSEKRDSTNTTASISMPSRMPRVAKALRGKG